MEQNEVQKIKFFLKNHPGLLGPFPNESKLQTKIVCKREASGIWKKRFIFPQDLDNKLLSYFKYISNDIKLINLDKLLYVFHLQLSISEC